MDPRVKKFGVPIVAVGVIALVAWVARGALKPSGPCAGFVSGNGRIEATEIDVATKLAGRVRSILVGEGYFVTVGQTLVLMQVDVLDDQYDEALAQSRQAVTAVASAEAEVATQPELDARARRELRRAARRKRPLSNIPTSRRHRLLKQHEPCQSSM